MQSGNLAEWFKSSSVICAISARPLNSDACWAGVSAMEGDEYSILVSVAADEEEEEEDDDDDDDSSIGICIEKARGVGRISRKNLKFPNNRHMWYNTDTILIHTYVALTDCIHQPEIAHGTIELLGRLTHASVVHRRTPV